MRAARFVSLATHSGATHSTGRAGPSLNSCPRDSNANMDESRLIAVAMGGLLACWLLAAAFDRFRRVAVLSSSLVAASAGTAAILVSTQSVADLNWLPASWLRATDGLAVTIELGQSIDARSGLILLALCLSWAVASQAINTVGARSILCWLGLQIVVTLAATATDLVIVLLSWLAIEELVAHIAASTTSLPSQPQRDGIVLPLRASSLVLLGAMALLQTRYHSTTISTLLEVSLQDTRVDAATSRGGIATVLALAIMLRCGLFPCSLWLKRLLASGSTLCVPLTAAIVVPALVLAVRFIPLWQATDETPRLFFVMGTVGVVPLILTGLTLRRTSERCCLAIVALSGLASLRITANSELAPVVSVSVFALGLLGTSFLARRALEPEATNDQPLRSVDVIKTSAIASLRRLPRHWWYLEEVTAWCVVLPVRWLAAVLEFADRVILCGAKEDHWTRHVREFADMLDAIRLGRARYYALAVLWVVVGLGAVVVLGQ